MDVSAFPCFTDCLFFFLVPFFGPFFSFVRLSGFRHWASRESALAFGQLFGHRVSAGAGY